MQPEAFLMTEVGEIVERVDGAGFHASRVRGNQERAVANPAVSRDGRAQVGQVHAEIGSDRHLARGAKPEREGSLLQAGMTLRRHVHGEPWMALEALLAHVPAVDPGAPVPRDLHAVPVRVGPAAEEDTVAPVLAGIR